MAEETLNKAEVKAEKAPAAKPAKKRNKYLWGFLHFLMYGGWILIVAIVLGVIIAISVMTK